MKRDKNIVLGILKKVQEIPIGKTTEEVQLEDENHVVVQEHLRLLVEAGYVREFKDFGANVGGA